MSGKLNPKERSKTEKSLRMVEKALKEWRKHQEDGWADEIPEEFKNLPATNVERLEKLQEMLLTMLKE